MSTTPRNPKAKKEASKPSSQATRREELRRQQEAAQAAARRRRMIWAIAGLVALVLILGGGYVAFKQLTKGNENATGLTADKTGWVVTKNPKPGAPEVRLYSDFQCPGCGIFEHNFGSKLAELGRNGDIKLSYHTMYFLDRDIPGANSERAARAAACATKTGHYVDYFATVYKNQPEEGKGYTDDQLLNEYPAQAGITGGDQESLQRCYRSGEMNTVVENMNQGAQKYLYEKFAGKFSTPTIMVNDSKLDFQKLYDVNGTKATPRPDRLLDAIKDAQAHPSATPTK